LLFVINSSPTSINSSRCDELLEVVFENDGNDLVAFNGSDDTITEITQYLKHTL